MPVDPRDERDDGRGPSDGMSDDGIADSTGELPLVVPVSDTIGAVDLGMPDQSLTPTGEQPASDADSPTDRQEVAGTDPPTGRQEVVAADELTGRQGDVAADAPTVRQPVSDAEVPTGRQEVAGTDPPTGRQEVAADAAAPTVPQPAAAAAVAPRPVADPTPVAGSPMVVDVGDDEPARHRRWWPRVLLAAGIVLALIGGYYLFNLWQVWSTGRSDEARPVDAIVVMGAAQYDGRPSPQLAARLDHAAVLWSEGLAPRLIVTGGNRPGDRFTEAEASGTYLVERGVPAEALRYENAGANTYDSLVGVAEIMRGEGLEDALIVTDPYHALRSKLTAEELGIVAHVSPTPSSVVTGAAEARRELGEAAGVALGRIIGFDRLASLSG